jgi:phosphoglycolate phosphatase-like HAD superfamily hydrolase
MKPKKGPPPGVPVAARKTRRLPTWHARLDDEYSPLELEFLKAIDAYKREQRRPFPTCAEVLAVLKSLGYRKP